jgi:hypothetical protein
MEDYADLLIALSGAALPLPKPPDTPELVEHRQRARAILMPLLLKRD